MPSLFLAISTANNIANVIPIIELVKPGDAVAWLETDGAKKNQWTPNASEVLREHAPGIAIEVIPVQADTPNALATALKHFLADNTRLERYRGGSVYFVCNGGTKLHAILATQQLAAVDLEDRNITLRFVYNEDRDTGYSLTREKSLEFEHHTYRQHPIDLPDILKLRGKGFARDRAQCLWRSPALLNRVDHTALHSITVEERGLFANATNGDKGHQRALQYYKDWMPPLPRLESNDLATPQQAKTLAPGLWNEVRTLLRSPPAAHGQYLSVEDKYFRIRKLMVAASNKAALDEPGHARLDGPRIGDAFEAEVAHRFLAWLQLTNRDEMVQSVWKNVLDRSENGDSPSFELDIAVVFKNGLIISLECKSGQVATRDIDGRENNLQRVASSIARIVICSPMLVPSRQIGFADSEWFRRQHGIRARFDDHIPYTLPNHHRTYRFPSTPSTPRPPDFHCPNFEEACAMYFGRYGLRETKENVAPVNAPR